VRQGVLDTLWTVPLRTMSLWTMPLRHPMVLKVTEALQAAGAAGTPVALAEAAPTAAAAAAQLGCDVGAIANSLVFRADGEPLLVLTSGAHRVDTAKVAALLDVATIERADPEFVRMHTGMAIGGVAPVGHPQPVRTLVDVALAAYPVVWAAAGHPHTVFPTSYSELLSITGGASAEVA
jgi:prolyl-tRNA editing enzyme YbaK/EbsC (Cys-tRNA(Pro) deacylase)